MALAPVPPSGPKQHGTTPRTADELEAYIDQQLADRFAHNDSCGVTIHIGRVSSEVRLEVWDRYRKAGWSRISISEDGTNLILKS